VPATQPCAQVQGLLQEAWATGQGVVQGTVQSLARLPSRERDAQSTGRDPLLWPPWRRERGGMAPVAPNLRGDL